MEWIPVYLGISLLAVSLFEYWGHRLALHRPTLSLGKDHLEHHALFARDFYTTGETPAFYDRYWVRGVFGLLWTSVFWIPLLLAELWIGAAIFATVGGVHTLLWQWTHNEMHRPWNRRLQDFRWFRFVRDFHLIHHQKSRTNFAFVFAPFWDWMFGTYRRSNDRRNHS